LADENVTRADVLNNLDTILHCSGSLKRVSSDGKDDFRNQMFGELKYILYAIFLLFLMLFRKYVLSLWKLQYKKNHKVITLIKQC